VRSVRCWCWRRGVAWDALTAISENFEKEIGLLRGLPMLQPLPLPAIEQLARGLDPVRVPAGQAVFHQGDPADRFYVIESGAADVVGDGRLVTALGPGMDSARLRCCAGCSVRPRCGRPPTWNFRL
jgi:hypothetical protein